MIANSFGDGRAPWIGGRDAAELAVAELLKPAAPEAVISYPPAAELLSHADIADVISAEIGREIGYRQISHQDWRAQLETQADAENSPVNKAMAQHISIIGAAFAVGKAPSIAPSTDTLTAALGHPPARFADFVREHRVQFDSSATATN